MLDFSSILDSQDTEKLSNFEPAMKAHELQNELNNWKPCMVRFSKKIGSEPPDNLANKSSCNGDESENCLPL